MRVNYTPEEIAEMHDRNENFNGTRANFSKIKLYQAVKSDLVEAYSVEIVRVLDTAEVQNLLLRVTDPALVEATGGIVQGMSGSPILQDGKLVGAVTHVMVNDPEKGYGILIENMLSTAAQDLE